MKTLNSFNLKIVPSKKKNKEMNSSNCITKEDFLKYEEVRKSGKYDMLFNAARIATGLSEDQYIAIRTHYKQLASMVEKEPSKKVLLNHV